MGNGSILWPKDCTSIDEVPFELLRVIAHANRILDWQENLQSDEVPPAWMWAVDHELEIWFENVEQKREEKYGSNSSADETAPMMSNQLARDRR